MTLRGSLAEFDLVQVLGLVHLTRKSGALTVRRADDLVTLHFRAGRLVRAFSGSRPAPLLDRLQAAGAVRAPAALDLPDELRDVEVAAGMALIVAGRADESAVRQLVESESRAALLRALIWPDGEFEFATDQPPPEEIILIDLDVGPLLEQGRVHLAEWRELLAQLPSLEERVHLMAAPPLEDGRVTLDAEQWRAVAALAAPATLAELSERLGLDQFAIRRLARRLLEAGLLARVDAAAAEPEAPEPRAAEPRAAEAAGPAQQDDEAARAPARGPEQHPVAAPPATTRTGLLARIFG